MDRLPRIHITDRGAAIILAIVAFALYANTLGHGFVWDDKLVITSNPVTVQGWDGIWEIITTKSAVPNKNVYRPVPQLMFAVEYALAGGQPWLSHLMNVLCYAALCVVVLRFLRWVFPAAPTLLLLGIGLVYAAHPLHVEVVANIKSRDELLAMLLGLLGVMALQRGCMEGKWWRITVGMGCFALALLSKTNALTLLPVALLVHIYREGGYIWSRQFLLLCGCLALVAAGALGSALLGMLGAACLLGVAIALGRSLRWGGLALGLVVLILALGWEQPAPNDAYTLLTEATTLNNVLIDPGHASYVRPTAIANIGRYLGLFVYPHPLIHMYGYAQVPLLGLGAPLTLLSLGLLIAGLAWCILGIPRRDPVAFGLAFFLCTLSIYSNFWVTAPDTMADRYLFMPSLGLCVALGFGLWALAGRAEPWWRMHRNNMVMPFMVLASLALGIQTRSANADWRTDGTLIKNRIQYMENNAAAQAMMGFVRFHDARNTKDPVVKQAAFQDALHALHRALSISPDFYIAWSESGKVFADVGRYDKAEACFLRAIQLSPTSPDAHAHLGTMFFFRNQFEAATPYLENAAALNPASETHMQMLGRCYMQLSKWQDLRLLGEYGRRSFPHNGEFSQMAVIAIAKGGESSPPAVRAIR